MQPTHDHSKAFYTNTSLKMVVIYCYQKGVNVVHHPYHIASYFLDANFPEFHEWAHYSGKFILGCYMKFDCGSFLQKLARMQLCPDGLYKHLNLKPWVAKYFSLQLQLKPNSSGWVCMGAYTASDRRPAKTRLFSMHTATANGW